MDCAMVPPTEPRMKKTQTPFFKGALGLKKLPRVGKKI